MSPNQDLIAAVVSKNVGGVTRALESGADVETRDSTNRTPLLIASLNDDLDSAKALVAAGANPNTQDDMLQSAWLVTGVTGSVAMLELLLTANPPPDLKLRNRYGGVSVIPASERGHVDYVRRVLKTGVEVNHVNNLGWTALLEAVILGDGSSKYADICGILLEAGARDIPDKDGVGPLEHARKRGQREVAKVLEEGGCTR